MTNDYYKTMTPKYPLGRVTVEGVIVSKIREVIKVKGVNRVYYPMRIKQDDGHMINCNMPLGFRTLKRIMGARVSFSLEILGSDATRSYGLRPTQCRVLKFKEIEKVKRYGLSKR